MEEGLAQLATERRGAALGLVAAGALLIVGALLARPEPASSELRALGVSDEAGFWIAFLVGGILIAILALVFNFFSRLARLLAIGLVAALVVVFVVALTEVDFDTSGVLGYGFISGGLVVAVVVMFTDSISRTD